MQKEKNAHPTLSRKNNLYSGIHSNGIRKSILKYTEQQRKICYFPAKNTNNSIQIYSSPLLNCNFNVKMCIVLGLDGHSLYHFLGSTSPLFLLPLNSHQILTFRKHYIEI